ncbi:MAG: c-type cytochrome [Dehalococcoidia bacterium]|nr:c-type cytochrome [Dehalococcoidia bacterium]
MNTSKQVNVMIGLLFLAFLAFGAYIVNEPNRSATAAEAQDELLIHRGADLFVANCRTCHGLVGEGGIGPALDLDAFLIFEEGNEEGAPVTPEGDIRTVETFLHNTIACGREGTAMPVWSERFGGPLSETQINYLVQMITTPGAWETVEEIGHEHDIETDTDPATVVLPGTEAGTLGITHGNCGQYRGESRQEIISRDPFSEGGEDAEPTPTELPAEPEAQAMIQGVLVGQFFQTNCSACHGADRGGGVGLPLLPSTLTQADDFYVDTITNGREGTAMPAWGEQMTPEEIQSMVTFLKNVEP